MDTAELYSILSDGLPPEEASKIQALINREATKARVALLKSQKEFEEIQTRADKLQNELDYVDPQGQPKGYRAWYKAYEKEVFQRAKDIQDFDAKWGEGAFARAVAGQLPTGQAPPSGTPPAFTPDDIKRQTIAAVQEVFAPMWSELLTGMFNVSERHRVAGRKNAIDIKALEEIARAKYKGNLELAYDDWDKPERDRIAKEAVEQDKKDRETEIQKRVNEELAKRNVPQYFPTGADLTPSSLTQRSDEAVKGFDRNKFQTDLMTTFYNAGQERAA